MEENFEAEYLSQLEQLKNELISESSFQAFALKNAASATEKLTKYYNLLVQWNESTDLIAPAPHNEIIQNHFIDSVAGLAVSLSYLNKIPSGVIDVGSGAGFPGLVWGVVVPELSVKLVDSRKKRCDFLSRVVSSLGLKNVAVVCSRIEDVEEDLDSDYDFSICRALGREDDYLAETKRVLSAGGMIAAMVGPSWNAAEKKVDEPVERIDYRLSEEGPARSVVFW